MNEPELQIGELVKWNGDESGRIDEIIGFVGGFGGGIEYLTKETNPKKGKEPKLGKQFFDSTGDYKNKKVGIIRI